MTLTPTQAPDTTAVARTAATPTSGEQSKVGRHELGTSAIASRAVAKIAALAAVEIPDAGGSGPRLLGRSLPGAGHLGIRGAGLDSLPKVNADVDGSLGFLDVELAVLWPAPVAHVADAVRQHLHDRVGELVGLEIREVNIEIVELLINSPSTRVS